MSIIGKCSCCGGNVEMPDVWYSTIPPVPTCTRCFAIQDDLPTIKTKQEKPGFFELLVKKFEGSSGNS